MFKVLLSVVLLTSGSALQQVETFKMTQAVRGPGRQVGVDFDASGRLTQVNQVGTGTGAGSHSAKGANPKAFVKFESNDEINVAFGGVGMRETKGMWLASTHPQELRMQRCQGSLCEACAIPSECWHGEDVKPGVGVSSGQYYEPLLSLNVAAGSAYSHFRASILTTCSGIHSGSRWLVRSGRVDQGVSQVNGDVILVQDDRFADKRTKDKPGWGYELFTMHAGLNKMLIDFIPKNSLQTASAKIEVLAYGVQKKFEECISGKACLKLFADGSPPNFAMRNKNKYQLQCLQGNAEGIMRDTCDKWYQCLAKGGEAKGARDESKEKQAKEAKEAKTRKEAKEARNGAKKAKRIAKQGVNKGAKNKKAKKRSGSFVSTKRRESKKRRGSMKRGGSTKRTGSNRRSVSGIEEAQGIEEALEGVTAKGTEQIKFLTALLLASGVNKESKRANRNFEKGNSLGEATEKEPSKQKKNENEAVAKEEECISPDTADPEAMECECMEKFEKACGGIDEACFRQLLCTSEEAICQDWKDENCHASLLARGTRVNFTRKEILDETLNGKCAI